jgi:tetratricopeptide (TPR) repeat protein
VGEGTDTNRNDPQSDLFKLDSGITSIPDHVEFVPTPEEIRQKRIFRALKITAAAVTVAAVVFGTYGFIRQRSRAAAIAEACRHGRLAAFEDAIALTDDDGTAGWLRGAAALGRSESDVVPEGVAIIRRAATEESSVDAKLAGAYAALLEGDVQTAHAEAEGLALAGDLAPEVIFFQSLAAEASARHEAAVARASVAHQLRPDSTRYVSRWATALVQAGRPDDALARLERAPGDAPDVLLARARAELAKGGDPAPALATAQRVLGASEATTSERAWAHLVTTLGHLITGDRERATAAANEARSAIPAADETFRLRLAAALLALGRVDDAEAALGAGERAVSANPGLRALVRGRIALARDDAAKAAELLGPMPIGPERTLLEGGIAEARGTLDQAAEAYLSATRTPAHRANALALLVRVEIAREQPESAARHAEALLADHPNHPDYVPVAVDAFAANADIERARSVLEVAKRTHGDDLRIEAATGRLHLAAGEWDRALAVLSSAAERAPDDSAIQVDLGDAARRSGDAERSLSAYTRAIELRPHSVRALLGLLELALDRADVDVAREKLAKVDELVRGSDDPRLLHLRARFLVASGAGDAGMDVLRGPLRSHRRDGALRMAFAELCLQAEQYAQAARYFDAATRLDGVDLREALAGIALAHSLGRRLGTAQRALEQAAERTVTESGDPALRPARTAAALAAIEARELVTQGRIELLEDHGAAARRSVARALEKASSQGDALLLRAELAADPESLDPGQLRQAWLGRPRQPRAAGRLAVALGPTEEGCTLGRAYLSAAPRGEHAGAVRAVVGQCPSTP